MLICRRCKAYYPADAAACPHCAGDPAAGSEPEEHAEFDPAAAREAAEPFWNAPPTEPPGEDPPDVRSKWTQRSLEVGFLFGAGFAALLWLAAAFRYAALVASGQESLSPAPITVGLMLCLMTIPIVGFCCAIAFGMVVFFTELAVRTARRGAEPDVRALRGVLSQANRRFEGSRPAEPPETALRPPDGLTAPPEDDATASNADIRP